MKYKIGELAEIIDGDRGKNYPKQEEFHDTGFCLFLDTGNVTRNGFSFENNHFITEEKCNVLRNGKLKRGDIAYTTRGTVGNAAYYSESVPFENIRINSGMVIIRVKDEVASAPFIYQLLKHDTYRLFFKKYCTGSAQPQLPIKNFSQIELDVPEREKQVKIAAILSTYDSLIENNQRQIKLLEEAAQRLYKEWFVDLRFPGYENVPVPDGVPEGWEKVIIADICKRINAGGTPNRGNPDYWNNATIKWYKTGELQDCWLIASDEQISVDGLSKSSAKLFPANTILMAIYASPTLGRLGILSDEAASNQAALCLVADEEKVSWQWLYQKLYELRDDFNAVAKGAGQQNISADIVKNKEIILPNCDLIIKYTNIVVHYFEKRLFLQKQIVVLQEARDRLLPKLMSGEIEV